MIFFLSIFCHHNFIPELCPIKGPSRIPKRFFHRLMVEEFWMQPACKSRKCLFAEEIWKPLMFLAGKTVWWNIQSLFIFQLKICLKIPNLSQNNTNFPNLNTPISVSNYAACAWMQVSLRFMSKHGWQKIIPGIVLVLWGFR
jgi:hypothetical protein